MSEKFDKRTGEKTLEAMRKISGEGFKPDESIEKMIDRFGEIMVEIEKIKLADNLNYADGNPRQGENLEVMKKELKRMKFVENREEPFRMV